MRAIRYHDHGGPDVLRLEDVARPKPGPEAVRIDVEAAAVNPMDADFREGSKRPATLPWTPGSDAAGVVDRVGDDVERVAVGDRVFATGLGRTHQGTCAEYVVAPSDLVATLPEGVSFAEGAALGLVGVTAWRALETHASVEPGERCLVHGASGGVGHVAVQLAAASGARVTATASEDVHNLVRGLGADRVLDYERVDLADAIVDAGRPDVVIDHRLDEYLDLDAAVAARGATVVGIGNTQPEAGFADVAAVREKELTLSLMSAFNTPDVGRVLDQLGTLVVDGKLAPEIARRYSLADTPRAHRAVVDDHFVGKLVVEPER